MQDHPHVRETPCHDISRTKNRASTVGGTREKGNQRKEIDKWDASDKRDKQTTNEMADKRDPQPATFHFVQQSRETSISENSVWDGDMIKCNSSKAGNNADGISWRIDIGKRDKKKKRKRKRENTGKWEHMLFHVLHIWKTKWIETWELGSSWGVENKSKTVRRESFARCSHRQRFANGAIIIPHRPCYKGFKYHYTVQGGTPASDWYQYQYQYRYHVGYGIKSSVKISRWPCHPKPSCAV